LRKDVKIEYVPARPADFSGIEISNERAKNELGWEPKVSFEEGIRRYIDWYRKTEDEQQSRWAQLDKTLKDHL